MTGNNGGEVIQSLVKAVNQSMTGAWTRAIAVATLFVAATGIFVELQDSLNSVWSVRRDPGRGVQNSIKDRLLSFALIVGIGLLVLVSLVLSAGLSPLEKFMLGLLAEQETVWHWVNCAISFGVITLLFAPVFKVLPDVKIAWRDVWIGAIITALLFNSGKPLVGLYLGRSGFTAAYGAAGSLIIVLVWVYYTAQSLFLGGKFTQVYANRCGVRLEPMPGAEAVILQVGVINRPPMTSR